jgi:secondary thiamine-phosphate synthase enzyme
MKVETMVKTETLSIETKGNCHIVDITTDVQRAVAGAGIADGTVTVFNVGSTAGVTTIEYEPGLVNHDINAAFEKVAPQAGRYEHEETWHDDNGHAHVRATMLGPSLVVPFCKRQLTLGTWQQIVLIDFDTRRRTRKVVCQIMGE